MQQSNANGKSALSGPHDHGIWNGLRHESVNFKYLSWKNGRMGGSGVHMGKEAKEKRFVKIITDVATKWVPSGTKNGACKRHMSPGRLYQSSGGNPSTKKGPTKGKAAPLESIRWVLERCLVKIIADVGHEMDAKRDAKWSLFGGLAKRENSAPV